MFNLEALLRPNIKNLVPYSSARDEFKGKEGIFLDANENSFGSAVGEHLNRYPDPLQWKLKEKISKVKGVPVQNIFLGNGSDEPIDICYRTFCTPGKDNVIILPPTYGMYEVSANINDVEVRKVNMTKDFQLDLEGIEKAIDENTKLIWICSPNNPTGNSVHYEDIEVILNNFDGIVIIDEAYINFSRQKSFIPALTEYPNLVILQTLSKAWGLANIRLGMAFASEEIIQLFNKVKPPYNINGVTQEIALEAMQNLDKVNNWIQETVAEREKLVKVLQTLPFTVKVYPSDANFVLVKTTDAKGIYNHLVNHKIIIRDRSKVALCEGCLRITVGTPEENQQLISILQSFKF